MTHLLDEIRQAPPHSQFLRITTSETLGRALVPCIDWVSRQVHDHERLTHRTIFSSDSESEYKYTRRKLQDKQNTIVGGTESLILSLLFS